MSTAQEIINRLVDYIINPIILVIFAVGFFLFMYGLVEFLWSMRGGEIQSRGKQHMLWGIVGMLIMVSVYGIIALLDSTFGLDARNTDVTRIEVGQPFNFVGR